MIPSMQATNSDVATYPRDRRQVLESDWIVKFGPGEMSGYDSEDSRRKEDVDSPNDKSKAPATLPSDIEISIKDLQQLAVGDPAFPSTAFEEFRHKISQFIVKELDSSTSAPDLATYPLYDGYVRTRVQQLFSLASFLDLEPGMTNEFSEGLENVIEHYGDKALHEIEELVLGNDVKSSIAMEALQYVGNTDSDKWHDERRRTVERCLLKSPSVWVRDGAGLGLASLDDPKSIPALEKAILHETSDALRDDLTLVLHQLLDTLRER